MFKTVFNFFDKLEDKVRGTLSHYPLAYALIGAVGIILVWKGVWETAGLFPFLFGLPSIFLGVGILLLTGLLVSFFIGDTIIISGLKREKKLAEKTETEITSETKKMQEIAETLSHIEKDVHALKHKED